MPSTAHSIRFASALSSDVDTAAATEHVLMQLEPVMAYPPDLVMVYFTAQHTPQVRVMLDVLRDALEPRCLIGMSSEGVIGVGRELLGEPGIAVLTAHLPGASIHPFRLDRVDWSGLMSSPELMRQALAGNMPEPRAMMLLADPFSTPIMSLLPAIDESLPGAAVIGGLASGGRQPGSNRLIFDGDELLQGAVGVTLGGPLRVDCTISQGCRPVGKPLVITRSKRHLVQELAGRNALQTLQELAQELDEEDRQLMITNGLHVGRVIDEYKPRFGRGDFLIRGIAGVDEGNGYFAIADPQVRAGQTIQFHVRDKRTAREDFELLLEMQKLHGKADGALLVSCTGRGHRLFDTPDADARMVRDALGEVPLAGFFAAGEVGPIGEHNFIHGQTVSLAVFRSEVPVAQPAK